jgi:tetratricopeptide (TPR) repeat protein
LFRKGNALMKTILLRGMFVVVFLFFISLLPASSFGEIVTIKHTVKQPFGGSQSPDDARISGIAKAKREALEQAGTYIESLTVVKNSKVEKDEILALTAGVLKAEVMSQKNYASDDAFGIEIVVNVIVDTSILEERVGKQLQDRTHLTQLKDTQKREKVLLQKVAQLEEENHKLSAKKQSTKKLKKEFKQASQGLTAVDWFYKASALWDGKKYTDPQKAIEYLNNAIELNSQDDGYYYSRGFVYRELGNYNQAIIDFNRAIELNPKVPICYVMQGMTYDDLRNYNKAIISYSKAIELYPQSDLAILNRGTSYARLGNYNQALKDYNKVIELDPKDAEAYYFRGATYRKLNNYNQAIKDFDRAIELNPQHDRAYVTRGATHSALGNDDQAITDFDKAIELNPQDAEAYGLRGAIYGGLRNYNQAISDMKIAARLGHKETQDFLRGQGIAW